MHGTQGIKIFHEDAQVGLEKRQSHNQLFKRTFVSAEILLPQQLQQCLMACQACCLQLCTGSRINKRLDWSVVTSMTPTQWIVACSYIAREMKVPRQLINPVFVFICPTGISNAIGRQWPRLERRRN